MDNLHVLKILLKSSISTNNDLNKKLFEFLDNNYKEIIDCNYYIQPILVNASNIDYFVKKNIESTPSLLDETNNTTITGLNQIIKYIVKLCESNTNSDYDSDNESQHHTDNKNNTKSDFSNDNSDLQNYLLGEAFKEDDTIEDPLDLNLIKTKEDQYKLRQEKKINPKYSNRMIETVKNNLNNSNNNSVENYNDYQEEYNNLNEEVTKTRPVSDYMSDDKDLQKFWENLEESC
jgi:hypothetical protein